MQAISSRSRPKPGEEHRYDRKDPHTEGLDSALTQVTESSNPALSSFVLDSHFWEKDSKYYCHYLTDRKNDSQIK